MSVFCKWIFLLRKLFFLLLLRVRIVFCYKSRIAICCIAKYENLYIREWVEYHKSIGVDRIYIYDNNEPDGERLEDVIGDYIKDQFCIIVDFRGKVASQLDAYSDMYQKYGTYYDWIAFIDCDEFLTIGDNYTPKNLKSVLNSSVYQNFHMIHINWMCYGDCGALDYEDGNIQERFPEPIKPLDFCSYYDFPENNHVKTIMRGNLSNVNFVSPHFMIVPYCRCCNAKGENIQMDSAFTQFDFSNIYIRHYQTKTIGEWVKIKMKRGYADQPYEDAIKKLQLGSFFAKNIRTHEKVEFAERLIKMMQK